MSPIVEVLDRLLDADELTALVGRPARAASVRVKPGTLLVVGLAEPASGRPTGWARVLWPVARDKAAKTADRARRWGLEIVERSLPGGLLLQAGGIATDPGLAPHLRRGRPRRMRRLVMRPEAVLRHNPLRRVLLRDRDAVVRVAEVADPVARPLLLRLGTMGLPVPEVLDDGGQEHVTVRRFFGDTDLLSTPCPDGSRWAGQTLAKLHAAGDAVLADPVLAALRNRRPPRPTPNVVLSALEPALGARFADTVARVAARGAVPGPPVLLHGDASADQVLVDTATGCRQLNDFDRAHPGPAALDLGSWLAVDRIEGSATGADFLAGYVDAGGILPGPDVLTTALARALLSRATAPARSADPDWRAGIAARLDDLDAVLG